MLQIAIPSLNICDCLWLTYKMIMSVMEIIRYEIFAVV